jgi:RHS repeat-associated protein
MKPISGRAIRTLSIGFSLMLVATGSAGDIVCPSPVTFYENEQDTCPEWATWYWPPGMCNCDDGTNLVYYHCWKGSGGIINPDGTRGCWASCGPNDGEVKGYCVGDVEVPDCPECTAGAGGSGGSSGPGGPPSPPTAAGHPVSLTTGNIFFTHTDTTVGDLVLTRTYHMGRRSQGRYGVFGVGWNGSFEQRIRSVNARIRELRLASGFAQYYSDKTGAGVYESILPATKESWLETVGTGGYKRVFRTGGFELYGVNGKIQSATGAAGVETSYAYDERTRLTGVSRLGRSITFTYSDDSDRPWEARGPGGALLVTYSYDGDGRLASVAYPDGGGYRFGYDHVNRPTWISDLDGNTIERHEYEYLGRALTSEIGDGREKLTFSWPVNGKTVVTDALGVVTEYEYGNVDGTPRVTSVMGPCASCGGSGGSGKRVWTYNGLGNAVRYQNEVGDVWQYTYEDHDLLSETNPLGQTTSYTRYPDGRVHTVTGPDGSLTTYTYEPAGPRSITQKVTSTEDRTTWMTYTPQGRVEDVTDPRGKVTHMTYTPNGDLETVTDPLGLGHTTAFGYDEFGRRRTVTDALDHTTTTEYDARGRVRSVIQHDTTHTDFAYDKRGNRTAVTDPQGRVTQYIYDRYGLLEKVIDPAGGVTTYGYDLMGHLTSLRDAMSRTTRFVYEQGRLIRRTYPGVGEPSETYAYDDAGRIVTKLDRKGVTTTFEYDALSRLTRKTYSDGTPPVSYTYDENGAIGHLTSTVNGTDTLRWSYDLAGQLRSEQSTKNAAVVSYGYDAAGNRLSLSLDGQVHVSYGYDDASRLASITRGTAVFEFGYDDANRRTSMTYPNTVVTSYGYDDLNRLTSLQAILGGTTTITSFGYTYDAAGNRLTKTLPEFSETYGYDALYRLNGVERTGASTGIWQFAYDPVGNRTTSQDGSSVLSSAYNEKNQLLSSGGGGAMLWRGTLDEPGHVAFTSALVNGKPARMLSGNTFEAMLEMTTGTNTVAVQATDTTGNVATANYAVDVTATGASYTYDSNGNLTTKTEGTDTWTYSWNAENQLTKVEKNAVEVARFAYDPLGARVEKVAGGVTTSYTYDDEDLLREVRGGTALKYVHGLRIDEPLAAEYGAGLTYFHTDGLGTIVKTTTMSGAVAATRQYDSWGNLQTGADQAGFAFTGREWDPETGLYYYRARYYDPRLGRFISEDPLASLPGRMEFGATLGYPLYAYANNSPASHTDPTGMLGIGSLLHLGEVIVHTAAAIVCIPEFEMCQAHVNKICEASPNRSACGSALGKVCADIWFCCATHLCDPPHWPERSCKKN